MRNQFSLTLYDNRQAPDAIRFQEHYSIQNLIVPPPDPISGLKKKEDRMCRFCSKKYPEVTFEKAAHIIPHMLGNEFLISDFECDSCNKVFSVYENQMANYLGISRTLWRVKGKKGVPNFYSPGNYTYAKTEAFFNLKEAVILAAQKYEFDLKEGTCTIEYDKNPYRPIQVFKIFLKIALCMMSEEELVNYSNNLALLLTGKEDIHYKENPFFRIYRASLPDHHNPIAILFKKRSQELKIPTHVMVFFFRDMFFQILIPNHLEDISFYSEGFQGYLMPPFHFEEAYVHHDNIGLKVDDMSEYELRREKGTIWQKFDPKIIENLAAYDPVTGEYIDKKFDPEAIVKIILIEDGEIVTFPKQQQ